ncbi:TolC family protein (plasmid) [Cetobacterium somerae]|uniref:TolC family protein n=1 Tax=Cetobacterium somerae TaxID=188913 RepID=UPI003D769CCA
MKKFILLFVFFIFSMKGYSQELGLKDILEQIETNNPEVQIKDLEIKIKEKGKSKALKNFILPEVNFSTEEEWGTFKNEGIAFKEIDATINIFEGGKTMNTYKRSKSELELAKQEKKITVYNWQEAGVSAYFNNLNYKKQREITNLTIDALEKQRGRLDALYRNNKMIIKSELLKIEAELENNKALNYTNAQRERMAKETLMKLLGYKLDKPVILSEFDAIKYLKTVGTIKKIENPKNTTLGKAQSLMVDIAEYDVKIAKSDLYPTIYVRPSHTFNKENTETNRYENVNEGRVEVGVRYTFAWGATLDSVAQSKYQLNQAKIKYDDNIKGIELEMRNKLGEIEALVGQSEAQKKRMDFLRENLKIDNLRYINSLITTFDYLNSVNQLKSAEEDYYILQRSMVLAVIEYENLYK